MRPLSEDVVRVLKQHLETGVPIEDIGGVRRETISNFHVAEQVWELMQQDPTLDERATLRAMGYSRHQYYNIHQMIELIIDNTETMSRKRAMFIVEREATRMIKMGEQQGDWHAIDAGVRKIIDTHQLDQPEKEVDNVRNTYLFPLVLAPVESTGEGRHSLSVDEKKALFKKYNASEDEFQMLVEQKVALRRQQRASQDIAEAEEIVSNDEEE